MSAYKADLSLRLHHPHQQLQRVAQILGLKPSQFWTRGDTRHTPKGDPLEGTRDESYCSVPLKISSISNLAEALSEGVRRITPAKEVLKDIVESGGSASIAVGWFCKGDVGARLPQELLAEMANLKVTLDLYVYLSDES